MPGILVAVVAAIADVRGTTPIAIRGAVAANLARLLRAGPNPAALDAWRSANAGTG
jgi:hypothetical protein